jgi:hypothetical protein
MKVITRRTYLFLYPLVIAKLSLKNHLTQKPITEALSLNVDNNHPCCEFSPGKYKG